MEKEKDNAAVKENDVDLSTTSEKRNQSKRQTADDAGPSGFIPLPGEVLQSPEISFQAKPGISQSEHSIRKFVTSQDVANALKMSSFTFTQTSESIKNINFSFLRENGLSKESDLSTFRELKNVVVSCLNSNEDGENIPLYQSSFVQNVQTAICATTNEQSQDLAGNLFQNKTAEIVDSANKPNNKAPNTNFLQTKLPKTIEGTKKAKTSGNLSDKSDFGLAPRDSLSSIGSNVCRICMTKGRERLISPCNCKGSLANVHLSCLERWLNQVGRNHCELCGFSYPAIRTPRYTVLQALRLWFGNPRNRSHLQSDCLIFWLLSTVTAGLLAVCIVGTQYFVIEGNKIGKLAPGARKDEGISHRITETAMDFFMAIVLCGYSITVYLLWKDHYVMWNRWRRANVNVRLLLTPDSNPVPFMPRPRYNVV